MPRHILLLSCLLLLPCACQRHAATPPAGAAAVPAPASVPATATTLPVTTPVTDVIEHDPRYIVGISYPQGVNQHPHLAEALRRYADAAHAELMQAVGGLGQEKPTAPYDLSLAFSETARTPRLIAIAADGSSYTGGAHGNPLVARFLWLVAEDRQLTIDDLVPQASGLKALSDDVRAQLHAAFAQRMDADDVAANDRADMARSAGRMIDEGAAPKSTNFAQFEPVLAADGRIAALRFVFPPYQVGPYSDGTQTVDMPADVLLPIIAPAYRGLFVGG